MEFGRRLAVDRELEKSPAASFVNAGKQESYIRICILSSGESKPTLLILRTTSLVFDESDNFIVYATLLGIKSK